MTRPLLANVMRARQRGAALLVALLVAALVTVTVTVMLNRQSALAGIEWQLRETAQARRILQGAEDWALLILREDARRSAIDHLAEPWTIPLQEGRLADFLKAAQDGAAASATDLEDSRAQDVWLSGRIVDAERRYNLMRLTLGGAAQADEQALWLRVAAQAGLPADVARQVAGRFAPPNPAGAAQQPPLSLAHLNAQLPALTPWAARLSELVVILPEVTAINVNTAAKPLLIALFPQLDDATAERFMQLRLRAPFRDVDAINTAFTDKPLTINRAQAGVVSRYFILSSRVRLGAGPGTADATEVNMTTLVERLAQVNRTRIVRRETGNALNAAAP
jgi:general secretion pathway protein K